MLQDFQEGTNTGSGYNLPLVRRTFPSIAFAVLLLAAACSDSTSETTSPPTTLPATTTAADAPGFVDAAGATLRFADATDEVGLTFAHSTPYSEENYTPAMTAARMIGGATTGDFNNDGWQDLFVIGGGFGRDALFVNQGDGTFEDIAEQAGVAMEPHLGSAATVGDFDGDGWLDLFVTSHGTPGDPQPGHHRLFRNNGDLTFTEMAEEAGVNQTATDIADGFGAVFADYDLDGDLDLFVAGWERDGNGDRLFRNEGDLTFSDVTADAGIEDNGIRGFSPCLLDTDGDRYPELMLVADFGTSKYWVNEGDGTFREFTTQSGAAQEWSGMGTTMGDFNNDGLVDWFATAIFDSEAEGRGLGNALYLNQGSHIWQEVGADAGVQDGGWGWGTVAIDLNLDGWLDLVETNGWILPQYTGEMAKVWVADGTGRFAEVAEMTGLTHDLDGLGMLNFDFDNDGDQDVAITSPNNEFRLYRNDVADPGAWLRVFLDPAGATGIAPAGIGSKVTAVVGDTSYHRWVGGCSNYLTHSEDSAHFGLGDASVVDELRVEWTDGSITVLEDVAIDQTITVSP